MHRDQIRLFPGDVESQVRRLERFRGPANAVLVDDSDDGCGESGYASRYLDYFPRSPRRRMWELVRETMYNPGLLLVVALMTLMSGAEPRIVGIIFISIFTGPAIWITFRAVARVRANLAAMRFDRRRHLILC